MKPHPFLAKIDNRWRARKVLKGLMLANPEHSENWFYYRSLYDESFLIP